jgi:hypothetical protein
MIEVIGLRQLPTNFCRRIIAHFETTRQMFPNWGMTQTALSGIWRLKLA